MANEMYGVPIDIFLIQFILVVEVTMTVVPL